MKMKELGNLRVEAEFLRDQITAVELAFSGHATCPECGHKGPHETNGARRFAELSLLCAGCGYSFDPADQ